MSLKFRINVYIASILLYCVSGPFFMWPLLRHYSIRYIITVIMCYFFYLNKKRNASNDYKSTVLLICSIFYIGIANPDNIYVNFAIALLLLPLVYIPIANTYFTKNVYEVFEKIYIYSIAFSLVCWIASIVGILPSFWKMNGLISQLGDNAYNIHLYCVRLNVYETPRFYGPYDEPGVVGTLSALLLVINKFDLKSKKCIILFITGILSLSLYFFVIVALFFVYRAVVNKKIIPVIILAAGVFLAYEKTKDIPEIQWRVWNRLTITDGKLSGDNRNSDYIETLYEKKKFSNEYWWGVNNWYELVDKLEGSSSYKLIVLKHGMVFFCLYCSFFLLYAYRYNKRNIFNFLLFTLIFLSCIYQRVYLYHGLYVFLFCYYGRFLSDDPKYYINKKSRRLTVNKETII